MDSEKPQKASEHDFEAELEGHLTEAIKLLNDVMGYSQAAYHTAHDLHRKTNMDDYRVAVENLLDVGRELRHVHDKIAHVREVTDNPKD